MTEKIDKEAIERIRKSLKRHGVIYPILVDEKGRLIDGRHRLHVWSKWPKVTIKGIKNDYDILAIRATVHGARRNVDEQETASIFRQMEVLLEKRGENERKNRAKIIAEDTGYSETYVYRLLSQYYPETPKDFTRDKTKPPQPQDFTQDKTKPSEVQRDVESKPPSPPPETKAAEFGKLGGRPAVWLLVCPQCGYKGPRRSFGKIKAED